MPRTIAGWAKPWVSVAICEQASRIASGASSTETMNGPWLRRVSTTIGFFSRGAKSPSGPPWKRSISAADLGMTPPGGIRTRRVSRSTIAPGTGASSR